MAPLHGNIMPPLWQLVEWPTPNYIDPVTQPKYVLVLSCILGPASIALFCARLWVRIRIQKNAGWDDWLMLIALFPTIALTIIFPLITERYYFNRHVWDVEYKYFPLQRYFCMAVYSLFSFASGIIKISVLLFYRRLSSRTVSPAFRWLFHILIALMSVYTIAFTLVPIFACSPISAFWNQTNVEKLAHGYKFKCINEGADVVANGVISTVQDLIVAILPTKLCWNLQMPVRQKVALYGIFAISYSTVIICAMRTYSAYKLFFLSIDVTWIANDMWLWCLLELHIGAMCTNAPALKIIFSQHVKGKRTGPKSGFKRQCSNDTSRAARSVSTFWEKVSFWKPSYSRNNSGYLSESQSQTNTSTDKHGGIIQTDVHIENSSNHDLEMKKLRVSQMGNCIDVQALPPIPPPKPSKLPLVRSLAPRPRPQQMCEDPQGKKSAWKLWERKSSMDEQPLTGAQ